MLDLITVFPFSLCGILDNSSDPFSSLFMLCFCYVQTVCCQIYVKFFIFVTKFPFLEILFGSFLNLLCHFF